MFKAKVLKPLDIEAEVVYGTPKKHLGPESPLEPPHISSMLPSRWYMPGRKQWIDVSVE